MADTTGRRVSLEDATRFGIDDYTAEFSDAADDDKTRTGVFSNIINQDKRAAAELYIRVTKDKTSVDDMLKIMNDTGNEYAFDVTPPGDMVTIQFMHAIGSIKVKPETWSDLLFPKPGK